MELEAWNPPARVRMPTLQIVSKLGECGKGGRVTSCQ